MPVVTVQLWEGRSVHQKRALVAAITNAMVEHVDADPSGLHVILQEVSPSNWGRAGVLGIDRVTSPPRAESRPVGLHHLLLQVRDLIAAETFYVDGLGFVVKKRDVFADGRPLTVTEQGLGLVEGRSDGDGPIEHFAFRVKNVEAYAERVTSAGGTIVKGPSPGPYGTSLYFLDADGNKVEFHE